MSTFRSKKYLTLAGAAGLIGASFAIAPSAQATLILSADISGTTFQCVDNAACDNNAAIGQIGLNPTTINGVQVTGNFDRSVQGSPDLLASGSTSVINTSGASRTISVSVGDTGFIGPTTSIDTSGSGTFTLNQGNGIVMRWYADPANTQGATTATSTPGTLIDTFSFTPTLATESFAHNAPGTPFFAGTPFSMTEYFTFTLAPGGTLTSRGQTELANVAVPEPVTLTLLGTGLVGLGLMRRRKLS